MWLYGEMLDLNWEIQYMNSRPSQTLHLLWYWDQSLDALARTNRNFAQRPKTCFPSPTVVNAESTPASRWEAR